MAFVQALFFVVISHAVNAVENVPDLTNFNPLKNEGYVPKRTWNHFAPDKDLSASVLDYFSPDQKCIRVVLFTGDGAALEDIKVSCDSPEPFLGLMQVDNALWFYGKAMLKRISGEGFSFDENKFITVKVNDDLKTCQKTYWIIQSIGYSSRNKAFGKSESQVKFNEDQHCTDLINLNIPPMMIMSPFGDVGNVKAKSKWSSYNAWEAVGGRTKLYMSGWECFKLLELYSFGRPVVSMKMACGPIQGIVMTEKAFYYGSTVMIKQHDSDQNRFTIFYNPWNGKLPNTPVEKWYNTKIISPACIKKTFNLIDNNGKYIKKITSIVKELEMGQECKDLVEGKFQGTAVENPSILELLKKDSEMVKSLVDVSMSSKLNSYKLASKPSYFNVANELGAVILFFGKSETDKLKVILVVAKGVALTGTVIETDQQTEEIVIRGDLLYHDRDIMARKVRNTYTVLIGNGGDCTMSTYELKDSNGIISKEEKIKQTVNNQNSDCKKLLEKEDLRNPAANGFNSAKTLPE